MPSFEVSLPTLTPFVQNPRHATDTRNMFQMNVCRCSIAESSSLNLACSDISCSCHPRKDWSTDISASSCLTLLLGLRNCFNNICIARSNSDLYLIAMKFMCSLTIICRNTLRTKMFIRSMLVLGGLTAVIGRR